MDLFDDGATLNLLPFDGQAYYHGKIMSDAESAHYFNQLLATIAWQNDEAIVAGKRIVTARKVAWYGERAYAYTYSNSTKHAHPWTADLLALKALVEAHTNTTFNSCLVNLYHSGNEGVGWHSDDEAALGANPTIASLTFGAARSFAFKHKQRDDKRTVILEAGGLLLMTGATQANWLHCLPKTTQIHTPRINLTFRTMVEV